MCELQDVSFIVIEEQFKQVQELISEWVCGLFNGNSQYMEECWKYEPSKGDGYGRSRIWEGENEESWLEKGGVNFSSICGNSLPKCIYENLEQKDKIFIEKANTRSDADNSPYKVTGVSIVFHPRNPHVPTIHMNVRYFETDSMWWFGGGIDLTPYYLPLEQVINFHSTLKQVCERHGHDYEQYKSECDSYFYLKHRKQARGVGGIFFDHLHNTNKQGLLEFVLDVAKSFLNLYSPLVTSNHFKCYSLLQREYQLFRRSRYAEFNLLWDRGTKFGIVSEGRTESILMSLPPICRWKHKCEYSADSIEGQLNEFYLQPQNWLNLNFENVPALLQLGLN